MNTIRDNLQNMASMDWKKEAKETLLPVAASLATGALVNYNNTSAFAVSYFARQFFLKPWNSYLRVVTASLPRPVNQKVSLISGVAILALQLAIPLVVGYKVGQYAGYQISPNSWVFSSALGGMAEMYVKHLLQEDPFKKLDILIVDKNNFQKEVIESKLPVVVDAYATWCPPCRAMVPVFSEVSKEWEGKVKFVKFNIDEDRDLAKQLNIQAVPTFIFFKDGKAVETHCGGLPKNNFMEKIDSMFNYKNPHEIKDIKSLSISAA